MNHTLLQGTCNLRESPTCEKTHCPNTSYGFSLKKTFTFSQDLVCYYLPHFGSYPKNLHFFLAQGIFEFLIFIWGYFRHYVIEYFKNKIESKAKITEQSYTIRVVHYLCDKKFHYLGTIRVTIIVYWDFSSKLITLSLSNLLGLGNKRFHQNLNDNLTAREYLLVSNT